MNIGIDIDDTITYTYETLLPMVSIKYGMSMSKLMSQKPSYKMLHNTLPDYGNFALTHFPKMAKIAPLRENVVEILNKLKKDGHKIIFITARNYEEYPDPYKTSIEYLKRNGVPFDKLIVNAKDKVKECLLEKIDVFIDDNGQICKAVQNRGITTIQMANDFTEVSKGLERLNTWDEIYKKICEIYV